MELKKLFGQNVQKYRKLRKLTQEKLAEIVGIDATSISSIETGKFFPTADNLQKIALALDIRPETLFFFENNNTNEEICEEIFGIINGFKNDNIRLNAVRNFIRAIV
ncbi:helix-turn-helix transcriptional regulator [bacterium]|nr:helix-turn-helix transcriptional regulator [bacterium]